MQSNQGIKSETRSRAYMDPSDSQSAAQDSGINPTADPIADHVSPAATSDDGNDVRTTARKRKKSHKHQRSVDCISIGTQSNGPIVPQVIVVRIPLKQEGQAHIAYVQSVAQVIGGDFKKSVKSVVASACKYYDVMDIVTQKEKEIEELKAKVEVYEKRLTKSIAAADAFLISLKRIAKDTFDKSPDFSDSSDDDAALNESE